MWLVLGLALASTPFAECLDADPEGTAAWRCVYMTARRDGVYDGAIAFTREALKGGELPAASLTLASLLADRGEPEAEQRFLDAALGFEDAGQAEGHVKARLGLATLYAQRGRIDEGFAQLELAREAAAGDDALTRTTRIQEARLQWRSGRDLGVAWRTLRAIDAEDADLTYQERLLVAHVLGHLSDAIERRGDALAYRRRVLALAEAEGDRYTAVAARMGIAEIALEERDVEVVDDLPAWVADTAALAAEAGHVVAEAHTRCLLGEITSGEESDAHFRACVEALRVLDYTPEVADALGAHALHLPPERADEALGFLDEADDLADPDDLFGMANPRWQRAVVLWRADRAGEALAVALEATRLVEDAQGDQGDELGEAGHMAHWGGLYHDVAALHLALGDEAAAWATLEHHKGRVLRERLTKVGVLPAGPLDTVSLDALRAALAPDEALIAFDVPPRGAHDEGGVVWAVTADGVARAALPDPASLRTRTLVYAGLLTERSPDEPRAAAALYDALLASTFEGLPAAIRRVVVVPDGPLHELPIEALARPDGARVFERWDVSYAPSATLWLAMHRAAPRPHASRVAVLADPPAATDPRTGAPLPPLPGARRESRAAVRRMGGAAWLGERATEAAFAGADARVVHVAAHALLDPTFPELSAVQLAPDAGSDGLLEAREIVGLDLGGRIVVLSACRSADGLVIGGEGPMGLARALFQGGAQAVVGTRWPLPDEAAAAFFDAVYAEMARGTDLGAAVGVARARRRAAGDSPEVWAGVVVLGDARAAVSPVPRSRLWALAVIVPLALLGLLWRRFRPAAR